MKSLLWIFISTVLLIVLGFIGKFIGAVFIGTTGGVYLSVLAALFSGSILAGRISRKRGVVGSVIGCVISVWTLGLETQGDLIILAIIALLIGLIAGVFGGYIGSRLRKASSQAREKTTSSGQLAS